MFINKLSPFRFSYHRYVSVSYGNINIYMHYTLKYGNLYTLANIIIFTHLDMIICSILYTLKGMEHVRNIFISFDKYLFLEVINILI